MCQQKFLAKTFNGSVSRCKECGEIVVEFTTTHLSMSVEDFERFYSVIQDVYSDYTRHPIIKKYRAVIKYSRNVSLVLLGTQVSELMLLLIRARGTIVDASKVESLIQKQLAVFTQN